MYFDKLPRPLQVYILLHVLAWLGGLAWLTTTPAQVDPGLTALLVGAAAVAGIWRVNLTIQRSHNSLVFPILCLTLLLQGVAATVAAAVVGVVVTHLVRPQGPWWRLRPVKDFNYRRVFNAAQCGVSALVAGEVFRWVVPDPTVDFVTTTCGLALFAAVHFLLNSWGTAGAIALERGLPPTQVWRDHFLWAAPGHFAFAALSLTTWAIFRNTGPVALALLPGIVLLHAAVRRYTDILRREHALAEREHEENRRKDEFLAMLAHELRNPLAPIANAAEILRHRGDHGPTVERQAELIERNVRHLSRLVDDLLEVSRINEGKIAIRTEPVDLGSLVEQAVGSVRSLIEARRQHLILSLPPEPVALAADPTRLVQVLVNLLNNAAKYTPEGGRVWLMIEAPSSQTIEGRSDRGIERLTDGGVSPSLHPSISPSSPAWVTVRVRDNGRGMAPELLARVFDLFVQGEQSLARTDGGLGIGLTLARRLVELHGGTLEARSDGPGCGSEFTIRLPLLQASALEAQGSGNLLPLAQNWAGALGAGQGGEGLDSPTPTHPHTHTTPHLRVLLVEDNRDAAETLAELLELWDCATRVVHTGELAVEAVRNERPHVVLLDIGLPGIDGYTVARRLREEDLLGGALLIALTGYGDEAHRRQAETAGFHHHLTKPVDPEDLRRLLLEDVAPEGAERFDPRGAVAQSRVQVSCPG